MIRKPIVMHDSWELMNDLGVDSYELIIWHWMDLKERKETDGLFVKEFKGIYGTLKILILLVEREVIEMVICTSDEFDEQMEWLRDRERNARAIKRDYKTILIKKGDECDKCMEAKFRELFEDNEDLLHE